MGRFTVAAWLLVLGPLAAAITLHAFVRETYDCGHYGNTLGLFCMSERRPAWVDPLALALLVLGLVSAGALILSRRVSAKRF